MVMDLVSDLRGAVSRNEIAAFYQPQVELESLETVGVEALARWTHPDYGVVVPSIFIALAEAHRLIDDISFYMIEEAADNAASWIDAGLDIEVAVNVSPIQLQDLIYLTVFESTLRERDVPLSGFVIEITESMPLQSIGDVSSRLRDLRDAGLGISIDDFGAGYSALTQLHTHRATELKLDKSLVQDPDAVRGVLHHVVEEAHELGMCVTAEGIETQDQLAAVRALGCDRGQGYLFGRPMPERELTPLLLQTARRAA